ncbi:MAG: hypothetical protein ACRDPY_37405 [Streptosporangiaceae bacterium]
MRLFWLAAEYERTCSDCGWSWRVPRSAARRRGRTPRSTAAGQPKSLLQTRAATGGTACMGKPARLRAEASPVIFASQAAGELRACPRCRGERFNQQPLRPGR